MSGSALANKFFDLGCPRASTGAEGVKRVSGAGTAGGIVLPRSMYGKLLAIKCTGAAAEWAVRVGRSDDGGAGAAATLTAGVGSTYAAGSAAAGIPIAVDEWQEFKVPQPEEKDDSVAELRLLWVGAAGTVLTWFCNQGTGSD